MGSERVRHDWVPALELTDWAEAEKQELGDAQWRVEWLPWSRVMGVRELVRPPRQRAGEARRSRVKQHLDRH